MKNLSLFEEKSYESVVTVPNIITFSGIIALVFYAYGFLTNNKWLLGVMLFLAGLSDLLDGETARILKQKTRLGEFLDPLRDRLLLLSIFLNIVYLNLDQLPFIILCGGMIVGFESLNVICNLTLSPSKIHLIGKLRQVGYLLAGVAILSHYFCAGK